MSGKEWSDVEAEVLRAGVAQGLSFGTIARELGVTRNAVIGKAHRLGLSAQKLNRGGAGAHKRKPKGKRMPRIQVMPRTGELVDAGFDAGIRVTEPGPTGGVTLLELRSHHCHWPLGSLLAKVDRFCGAAVEPGYLYCLDHGCRAYIGHRWERAAAELAARRAAQPTE